MKNAYLFACRNGYTGTFQDYLQEQYRAYCSTCRRCGIEAKLFSDWLEVQA